MRQQTLVEASLLGPLLAYLEHGGIDIQDGDMWGGPGAVHRGIVGGVEKAEGDIARAACHIEVLGVGPWGQHLNKVVLPQPVDPSAHEVIHHIVARRHVVEHLFHCKKGKTDRR